MQNYYEHYNRDAGTFDYLKAALSPEAQVDRRRAQIICRTLDDRLKNSSSRIADIGAGGGALLREMRRAYIHPIGVDIAPRNLRRISEAFRKKNITDVSFTAGDVYDLPFASECLDAMIMSEVLEHLEQPEKALTEAARILKPDAQLIVTVPYREKIVQHLCIHCNQLTPTNAHLHSMNQDKIRGFIRTLPLTIEGEILFHDKALTLLNIPGRLRRFPYSVWRTIDRIACLITRKPHFYLVSMRKTRT
mgnify:CR=1 FL=1